MIVVIDKEYADCAAGDIADKERAEGSGVFAEYNGMINELYRRGKRSNHWLIPVIFQDGDPACIPRDFVIWSYEKVNSKTWDGMDRVVQRLHEIPSVVLPVHRPDAPPPKPPITLSSAGVDWAEQCVW